MGNAAGWKVIIKVSQPNGTDDRHLWVVGISDEEEVREQLWLTQIPCEAQLEPLSAEELSQLGLEPGEVRRMLVPTTASPSVATAEDVVAAEPEPEEDMSSPAGPKGPAGGSTLEEAGDHSWGDADQVERHGDREGMKPPADQRGSDDRLWRRLWGVRHRQANE